MYGQRSHISRKIISLPQPILQEKTLSLGKEALE